MKDDRRIILYGERVLDREAGDPQILDRVARALLASDARDTSERALQYAQRYEEQVSGLAQAAAGRALRQSGVDEEVDRGVARALVLEARATGNLGKLDEALALARKSYAGYPTAEGAREIGAGWPNWAARRKPSRTWPMRSRSSDSRNTTKPRAQDRGRMGELYSKLNGSEKGSGRSDSGIVRPHHGADRGAETAGARRPIPTRRLASLMDFTLSGLDGDPLKLASLKGKTVVFDFWATWCGPCRAQHPLYEQVKRRFAG